MSRHPFHLVTSSPWPLMISCSCFLIVVGLVTSWSNYGCHLAVLGGLLLLAISLTWFDNVITEATLLGSHTLSVQAGLRQGMTLFVVSELAFFYRFFWAYLHSSLSPAVELGSMWPPAGITAVDPWSIPLLNTLILLTSGARVTWSHKCIISNSFREAYIFLVATTGLGIAFTCLQLYEYYCISFCISDSVFGSCFYLATGFHGLHVLIGTTFLAFSLSRLANQHYTSTRYLGFLTSSWYWHFVDVVWLLLLFIVYYWGGS